MRVLIADDDQVSREILRRYLRTEGYEVTAAADGQEALDILRQERHRLVVTDWMMPRLSGVDLIRRARADESLGYVYFIVVTVKGKRQELLEALEAGADDYVRKPIDREELYVRLRAGRRIVSMQRRLEELARTDPLTGLRNRRGLAAELDDPLRSPPPGMAAAYIVADLDHFKRVNDEHGHDAGDRVLREVAERLGQAFRASDTVSRIGGEEFLVVARGLGSGRAAELAERSRALIGGSPFRLPDGSEVHITCSFGVYEPAQAPRPEELDAAIQRADRALYDAKRGGRDRVAVWTAALEEPASSAATGAPK